VQERLKIAKEFGDRSAERRAHSNLGNAHIFLGEFEKAAEHYKQTLLLAQVPYTDKNENQIFLICREIQSEAVAKSYIRKGFLIYEEMRKYFPIYEEAVSHR
jgi:hypothetical protein